MGLGSNCRHGSARDHKLQLVEQALNENPLSAVQQSKLGATQRGGVIAAVL
jgi:hypothetical protein